MQGVRAACNGKTPIAQKYSVAGVEHRFRDGIREYNSPRRVGQHCTLWQHLNSLRRGEIRELQLPKPAIYAHSPAQVPRDGFEEPQLLVGQGILARGVGNADQR